MPVTVVATPGAPNANSFVTVAEVDAYLAERPNTTTWDALDADGKARVTILSSRRLDQERYEGYQSSQSQALQWPRIYAPTRDRDSYYDSTTIPDQLKRAVYELVLNYANLGTTDPSAPTGLEAFGSLSIAGALSFTLRNDMPPAGDLPAAVVRELRGLRLGARVTRLERA
jgi:hypothetical protein